MSDTIVKVEGLGKRYIISHETGGYTALRDVISKKAKGLVKGSRNLPAKEEFWALKDVSFEIKKGEAVGIIGRNGAGKSTLLKILSRITEPTTGRIELNGRVASLLEVGTGFHPELTGRENIYLNGAILGMTRAEIKRKFDEIVDFSGVEKFLDTPVKRFSSGMYVRLAFAVAAHLEPEILVVDEVLAVGDAEFQKKCLGKMNDVSKKEGRTVLFVSHNMSAVKSLCNAGLVLQNGTNVFYGNEHDAVNFYQNIGGSKDNYKHTGELVKAKGNENIRVLRFEALPQSGDMITMSSSLFLSLEFFNAEKDINLDVTFEVANQDDIIIFHSGTIITSENNSKTGIYEVKCTLPKPFFNAGLYSVSIIFGQSQRYALYQARDLITFEVLQESAGSNSSKLPGITFPKLEFENSFKF